VTDTLPLKSASLHVRDARTRVLFRYTIIIRTFDAMETAT
jgi:hypothetical protein